MEGLRPDPDAIRATYDRQATAWDTGRSRALFEEGWLRTFAEAVPAGGRVLDLGCGAGEPIAAWLMRRGLRVTGADISSAMLDLARVRWPEGDWRLADMRSLDLGMRFDGIIAWDSFFHLTPDEQRGTLPRLAGHLVPGGTLMATVGPKAGEVTGQVGGETVYHASLSLAEYATRLDEAGLRLTAFVAEDPTCDGHSILMACKRPRGD